VRPIENSRLELVLDFDIETRKIGFHDGGRFAPAGCEPVIIAASFSRDDPVEFRSLSTTWSEKDAVEMLEWFIDLWDQADAVTGHYIRKFDLPIINGALLEHGMKPLSAKRTIDTQADIPKIAGLSRSQENLGEMLRIGSKKFHMNDTLWRDVARLTRHGLDEAQKRVIDDVRQHQELRERLSGDWLKSPKVWRP
jgi:hypothetical protein